MRQADARREEALGAIRGLPDQVERWLEGLPDEGIRRRPSSASWSALEICCYLRDFAQLQGLRLQRLTTEDNPTLEPADLAALANQRHYQREDITRVRLALRALWGGLAYAFENLSEDDWQRAGSDPQLGRITIADLAQGIAEEANRCLKEIEAIVRAPSP